MTLRSHPVFLEKVVKASWEADAQESYLQYYPLGQNMFASKLQKH